VAVFQLRFGLVHGSISAFVVLKACLASFSSFSCLSAGVAFVDADE